MKGLLALALVLTVAGCGTAGVRVASDAPSAVALAPVPEPVIVPGGSVSVSPGVIPPGAVLVYMPDPRCPPAQTTITLPPLALRDCLSLQARLAAARIVKRDGVGIGAASPCYPFYGVERANCLDVAARTLPGVSYGMSGRWIRGLRVGEPWEGCAAGVSGNPIFVSLAEPWRVNALLSWEASNAWLWLAFDRIDLTDGPIISESTSAALTACGL